MKNYNTAPLAKKMLTELIPFIETIRQKCTARTATNFEQLLEDCSDVLSEKNKQYSLLTPGGYPIEFTFRSDSENISVTTEMRASNEKINKGLQRIQAYTNSFSYSTHPLLEQLTNSPEQKYSCWLGVRYRQDQPAFKLYQEITKLTTPLFLNKLFEVTGPLDKTIQIVPSMVGIASDIPTINEFYFRIKNPSPAILHQLFSIGDVAAELNMVLNFLCWLGGMSREKMFATIRLGISFQPQTAQAPGITIFAHVSQLCRDNIEVRNRIVKLAQQLNTTIPVYESISERLLIDNPDFPVHGMISIRPMKKGKMIFSVGLRPW